MDTDKISKDGCLEVSPDTKMWDSKNRVYAIIGRHGTGKTTLVKEIYKNLSDQQNFDKVVVFSLIEEEYDELNCKIEPMTLDKIQHINDDIKKNNGRYAVIIDDPTLDSKLFNSSQLKTLFRTARHYGCTIIVTMQHALSIVPEIRIQLDYICLFKENNRSSLKRMYDQYGGAFPDYHKFESRINSLDCFSYMKLQDYHITYGRPEVCSGVSFPKTSSWTFSNKNSAVLALEKRITKCIDEMVHIRNELKLLSQ